jgi:hypothetical protein
VLEREIRCEREREREKVEVARQSRRLSFVTRRFDSFSLRVSPPSPLYSIRIAPKQLLRQARMDLSVRANKKCAPSRSKKSTSKKKRGLSPVGIRVHLDRQDPPDANVELGDLGGFSRCGGGCISCRCVDFGGPGDGGRRRRGGSGVGRGGSSGNKNRRRRRG